KEPLENFLLSAIGRDGCSPVTQGGAEEVAVEEGGVEVVKDGEVVVVGELGERRSHPKVSREGGRKRQKPLQRKPQNFPRASILTNGGRHSHRGGECLDVAWWGVYIQKSLCD